MHNKFNVFALVALLFIVQGCVSRVSSTVTTPNGQSEYDQTCVLGNCGTTSTQTVQPLVGTPGYAQCVTNYREVNARAVQCEMTASICETDFNHSSITGMSAEELRTLRETCATCHVLQRRMDGYRAWLSNPPEGTDQQTLMVARTHFESTIGSMYREEPEVALTCTNLAPYMNGSLMAGFFGALGVGMGASGYGYTPGMVSGIQNQRTQVLYR